jgi:hypothetical protein
MARGISNRTLWGGGGNHPPQDALIDPSSGNLLIAMGLRGVLMREANGDWIWIKVGTYEIEKTLLPEHVGMLIKGQFLLAASFLFLGINTGITRIIKKVAFYIILAPLWAIWLFSVFVSSPANTAPVEWGYNFMPLIHWGLLYLSLGLSLISGIGFLVILFQGHRKDLRRILIAATIGAGTFLIPFILWAYVLIPGFTIAAILGCTLPFIPLLVGNQWHQLVKETKPEVEEKPQEKSVSDS